MKLLGNLIIQDFVPKEIYTAFGDKSIWFINKKVVTITDFIIRKTGKDFYVNNWKDGGTINYCGYRPPDCLVGASKSQHKLTNAADIHSLDMKPDEVRQFIRDNFAELNDLGLTTIEKDTPTWTHFDTRWTMLETLLEVPFQ